MGVLRGNMGCKESACRRADDADERDPHVKDFEVLPHQRISSIATLNDTRPLSGANHTAAGNSHNEPATPEQKQGINRTMSDMSIPNTDADRVGDAVIEELLSMKDGLWKKYDRDKDGTMDSKEAGKFIDRFLHCFLDSMEKSLPAGSVEHEAMRKTAKTPAVKTDLVSCFLGSLDVDKDNVVTKEEFFDGLEAALRAVIDKLNSMHYQGNKEAIQAAGYQACFSLKCPGFSSGPVTGAAPNIQILKTQTVGDLRHQIASELGVDAAHQQLHVEWTGRTGPLLPAEFDGNTIEEQGKLKPNLRHTDVLAVYGMDGRSVETTNKLHVTVMRLRRGRGCKSEDITAELSPSWSSSTQRTSGKSGKQGLTEFAAENSSFEWSLPLSKLHSDWHQTQALFTIKLYSDSQGGIIGEAHFNVEDIINDKALCRGTEQDPGPLGPYAQGRFLEIPIRITPSAAQQGAAASKNQLSYLVCKFGYNPGE